MYRSDRPAYDGAQIEQSRFVSARALKSYKLSNANCQDSAFLLRLPSMWVGLGHKDCAQVVEASNHKEWITAVLVLSPQPVLVNGYRGKAGDAFVLDGVNDLRIAYPASGFAILVSVPKRLWVAQNNANPGRWLPLNNTCAWSVLNHYACTNIGALTAQLRHLADARNFYSNRAQVAAEVEQRLTNELVAGLSQGREVVDLAEAPRCSTRARLVDRALLFCQSHYANRLAVSTLVQALHTSTRTLEYAFTEILGITPKQYLMRSQMNRIRWALLSGKSANLRVKSVVMHYGITNLGRFAAEYKQLFNETPAQTLRGSHWCCEGAESVVDLPEVAEESPG